MNRIEASLDAFDVFERGLREGVEALTPADRELYYIQYFVCEYEASGLSGYFYNMLPSLQLTHSAIGALRARGFLDVAEVLQEAAGIFEKYVDPEPPTTWGEVLRRYDPGDKLKTLEKRMDAALRGV